MGYPKKVRYEFPKDPINPVEVSFDGQPYVVLEEYASQQEIKRQRQEKREQRVRAVEALRQTREAARIRLKALQDEKMRNMPAVRYLGATQLVLPDEVARQKKEWDEAWADAEVRASSMDGTSVQFLKQGHVLLSRFDSTTARYLPEEVVGRGVATREPTPKRSLIEKVLHLPTAMREMWDKFDWWLQPYRNRWIYGDK